MKSAYSLYSEMLLIEIREGRIFFYGVARALDGRVTVDFLTNESRFR
jgi:hypothetical protein